jgi:hypothetical protein
MRYWTRWVHVRYEIGKRADRLCLKLACRMPARLRMWVVVDATNTARQLYPLPDGHAGPDGLGYSEIYDGALGYRAHPEGTNQ